MTGPTPARKSPQRSPAGRKAIPSTRNEREGLLSPSQTEISAGSPVDGIRPLSVTGLSSPSDYQRRYRGALRLFVLEQLNKAGNDGTPMAALAHAVERVLGLVNANSQVNVALAEFEALGVASTSQREGLPLVMLAVPSDELSARLADLTGLSERELAEFSGRARQAATILAASPQLPSFDYTAELMRRELMNARHNALQAWCDPISGRRFWAELAAAMVD